jgi:DNA primase
VLSPAVRKSLTTRVLKYHEQLTLDPAGSPLLDYVMQERQLSRETVDRFLLGAVVSPETSDEPARGMLAIPYLTPSGPVALRFRRPPEKDTGPKYWQPEGTDLTIFNVRAFFAGEHVVVITEGEIDCMTVNQCGIPAVGIPGASAWKDHYRPLFEGYDRVIICADNDDTGAGSKFAAKVARQVPGPEVVLMPENHDVNSFYCEVGPAGLREYLGVDKKASNG